MYTQHQPFLILSFTLKRDITSKLIELLPSAENSIEQVVLKLGYSKRTLQRKLKEENTTFQQQLNHTRELLAKHYLKNSDLTNEDIAYLLGYQDSNSFIRAFQMWTGVTISEYRKKQMIFEQDQRQLYIKLYFDTLYQNEI